MRRRSVAVLAGMVMVGLVARPAPAQVSEQLWRWIGGQGGFCVWYLADPELATQLVPTGTQLRTVTETSGLPPILLRIVQDEPRFASWIPGSVCIGLYADVASDGVPQGHMEEKRPVLLALTALAAHDPAGQPEADWYLREIGLDAGHLDRIASDAEIGSQHRELRTRSGLPGEDDKWELSLDGVKLAWSGHPSGEKRVGSTRSMSFGYVGERNSRWLVTVRTAPEQEQSQVGALRVEGKNLLAQALKSSPIRTVGPLETGGELTVSFRREAPAPR